MVGDTARTPKLTCLRERWLSSRGRKSSKRKEWDGRKGERGGQNSSVKQWGGSELDGGWDEHPVISSGALQVQTDDAQEGGRL